MQKADLTLESEISKAQREREKALQLVRDHDEKIAALIKKKREQQKGLPVWAWVVIVLAVVAATAGAWLVI